MDAIIFLTFTATLHATSQTIQSAVTFTMRHRQLSTFPSNITKLVQKLDLAGNRIECISATELVTFTKLEYLDLDYNMITYLEDGCFDTNTRLKRLELSGNMIVYFPKSLGPLCTSLRRLTLTGSIIKNIRNFNLSSISRINWLSLRGNDFEGMGIVIISLLPTGTYKLALDTCSMERFPDFNTYIPGIKGILFTENNLTNLSSANFKNLNQLRILRLSRNNLKSVPDLYNLSSLQELHLEGNPLVCSDALCWMIMWSYTRIPSLTLDAATCQSPYHLQGVLLSDVHPLTIHCYDGKSYTISCITVFSGCGYITNSKKINAIYRWLILVRDCSNDIANAMTLLQSCTNPSICTHVLQLKAALKAICTSH